MTVDAVELQQEIQRLREKLITYEEEIQRLKDGKFTEEEFQGLCHNFNESDVNRFMQGCRRYQAELFSEKRCRQEIRRQLVDAMIAVRDRTGVSSIQNYADAIMMMLYPPTD